jgi:hypothetical protein
MSSCNMDLAFGALCCPQEHAGSQAKSRHLPSGELELGQVGNALSEKLSWLGQS